MTNDITRAMARPEYWSRTTATMTTRGPATPRPCKKRPASTSGKLGATIQIRQPLRNSTMPTWMGGRRPRLSESGP